MEKVNHDYALQREFESMDYFGFTEVMDKTLLCKERELINHEKLKGRFVLKIKQDLPQPLQIVQFANDSVAFHLHKKRDFFQRLDGSHNPLRESLESKAEVDRVRRFVEYQRLLKLKAMEGLQKKPKWTELLHQERNPSFNNRYASFDESRLPLMVNAKQADISLSSLANASVLALRKPHEDGRKLVKFDESAVQLRTIPSELT